MAAALESLSAETYAYMPTKLLLLVRSVMSHIRLLVKHDSSCKLKSLVLLVSLTF